MTKPAIICAEIVYIALPKQPINQFKPVQESRQQELSAYYLYVYTIYVVAVGSSGILKGKQKLGVTFNSNKLGGIDFTKFSKLTMCKA